MYGGPALLHGCPPPNTPSSPSLGPSPRNTPGLAVERGGGPPRPGTKKPNLTARLHICPAPGQAPAVPTVPPPQGPGPGAPRARQAPPFLHPSSQPRPEADYRDRRAEMGRKWGPAFLSTGEPPARSQGHTDPEPGETELRARDPKAERGQASQGGGGGSWGGPVRSKAFPLYGNNFL